MIDISVAVPGLGPIPLSYTDAGDGPAVLILHGGAGPVSVGGFAQLLAASLPARVIAPIHPGFNGTTRPESISNVPDLARLYSQLLDALELTDVTVIGNSIGGWIAAELALQQNPRIGRLVLANAVGLQRQDHPIVDFFSLTMDQVFDLSYFEPDRFRLDPASMSPVQRAGMAANQAALKVYGGTTMADPGLAHRLPQIAVPAVVVWGAADRVVPPEHGQAYAEAIPDACLVLIERAGHLPQLETPTELVSVVRNFLATDAG